MFRISNQELEVELISFQKYKQTECPTGSAEGRRALYGNLYASSCVTRTGLAKVLTTLSQQKLLNFDPAVTEETLAKQITAAVDEAGTTVTPYGTVVQHLDLGVKGCSAWPYIHPLALLWFLSTISAGFGSLMKSMIEGAAGRCLNILLYDDGFMLGNPLRPDKGRHMNGMYWIILDLPGNLLSRAEFWLPFGYLRSTATTGLGLIPGGASAMRRRMLHIFFGQHGHTFRLGAMVAVEGTAIMFTARFRGNFGDELGLKDDYDIKGASGIKFCISCMNCRRYRPADDWFVTVACHDPARFVPHTNATVYEMVDRLAAARSTMAPEAFKALQTQFGINWNPHGLLFDPSIRDILDPVDHYIRDWAHTLVSNGVAGMETSLLLDELQKHGEPLTKIQEFADKFHLPHRISGKVSQFFHKRYLTEENVKYFIGELLLVIDLLYSFLELFVKPKGKLLRHVQCYELLRNIVGYLKNGPKEFTQQRYTELQSMVVRHASLWKDLYGDGHAKPKWHHLLHLAKDLLYIGKAISSLPGERKHRAAKAYGRFAFKTPEKTIVYSMLNEMAHSIRTENFKAARMIKPVIKTFGSLQVLAATSASLPAGEVRRGDVVLCSGNVVGEVMAFFANDEDSEVTAQIQQYTMTDDSQTWRVEGPVIFPLAADILATMLWAPFGHGVVRVILPAMP